ncbi:MAG: DNA gyrase subunit A [Clostridia bacterium]|nr:DNA gyrase subunit A [Clostridia bacterium]
MDEQRTQNTDSKVIVVDLDAEMRKRFLEYSMSVIVARALPDVRDGLKPVHRRILYTMHENGLTPDKAYRKSADTVGAVLGRYHPHGDASVYDAMVRMAQDFSLRYPLIDGHGNFGSVDGHPAAAYRYTEARLAKMSLDMLADIEKDTVDFISNYDDRLKEPVVLPSRFPNLLVNGSSGIAVGMATNVPPHNLCEVIDAICLLIDNPEAELYEIMEKIPGPDFPTGGIIMGMSGIRAAYATGRGKLTVRARTEIEESGGRTRIIVTEIPYQVNKTQLVKSIVELVDDKRIEGIHDIVDYSNMEGMRIVIDLKKDANPELVLNQLFAMTQMQITFGAIMLALVDGTPRILTLKQMLEEYIRYQCCIIERRTRFNLRKAQERAHIVEALRVAVDFIDEVVAIIRRAADTNDAKAKLTERFGFDEVQTTAIVQMRLGQLSGLERQKILDELAELAARIADFQDILANDTRVHEIVKEGCLRMRDKYGDERRTEISPVNGEVDIEDLIPEEESVLTLSHKGYIKRQAVDVYKAQRRGGRGVIGMTTREEDYTEKLFLCSSHDYVMFFTTAGRVYRLKCYEVPEGSRQSRGMNLINLLPLAADEKVSAMIRMAEVGGEEQYLCMVTRQGVIKRTRLSAYNNVRKNGLIAVDLDEGDELTFVAVTDGYQQLLVATRKGMAIRFDENEARVIGRQARGVRAIQLQPDDAVVGVALCEPESKLLTVTTTGYGRISDFDDYRTQARAGKGLINYHTETYGDVAAVTAVGEDDDVLLVSNDGVIIRIRAEEIRLCRRPSKGVRVMRLADGSRIVALVKTPHEEGETVALEGSEEDADADAGAETEPDKPET